MELISLLRFFEETAVIIELEKPRWGGWVLSLSQPGDEYGDDRFCSGLHLASIDDVVKQLEAFKREFDGGRTDG